MQRKTLTNDPDGYATGPPPPPTQDTPIKPVQRRLLVPLAIVLLLLVGGFESLLLTKHHDDLDQASQLLLREVSIELEESLSEQSENLEAIESVILNDKDLTASLAAQNQKALLSRYQHLYAQLLAKHRITHFYFHRPDLVNLLRLHEPSRSGDLIERFTLHEAKRTHKVSSGIELGPMGTFTLRVVAPVFDGETIIGYIELGKEIEDVLENARASREIELAAIIHKTNIHREAWQAGMKMMERKGNWDRFAADAVIYASSGHFPKNAEHLVGRKGRQKGAMVDVQIDGKPWHVLTTPLNDARGIEVGELFVFKDVSVETAQFNRMILVSSVVATILASILIVFLYFALRRVDRGIEMQKELENRHHKIKVLNESLEMACTIANAATRAKSNFLANMSHEIRTPMTSIIGFAENLLDTEQTDVDKLNCAHIIRRNGEQLLSLINDILDLSKIETGKMEVECVDCHPCRIIADVVTLMRTRAETKWLTFNVEYFGTIPKTIQSDPTRLRQILINLLGNAIKFTKVGGVRLVTRFVERGKKPCLQFDIIDSGRGMTQEQVAKLFQPFMQADNSTTRKFGGTGLGLTISKHFAELLGGDIIVSSTEMGIGTTFRATVTAGSLEGVKMLENPMSDTVVIDTDMAQSTHDQLKGLHILLAEDGRDNQQLISFILRKAGADVTIEENGKCALEKALAAKNRRRKGDPACPFDIILMDMQMPVMDGYEATSQLRKKGFAGPIIALTANAMASDREKCLCAGCTDYATKPVDRRKLIETIQQNLLPTETACPV